MCRTNEYKYTLTEIASQLGSSTSCQHMRPSLLSLIFWVSSCMIQPDFTRFPQSYLAISCDSSVLFQLWQNVNFMCLWAYYHYKGSASKQITCLLDQRWLKTTVPRDVFISLHKCTVFKPGTLTFNYHCYSVWYLITFERGLEAGWSVPNKYCKT